MKHVRLALGRSGVGGRFPRRLRRRRRRRRRPRHRRCRRRLRRCRLILGVPFRSGALPKRVKQVWREVLGKVVRPS